MRVLVTGGAGYIGSVLVPMLVQRGDEVRVFDRFYFGKEALAPVADRVTLVEGDLRWFDPTVLEGVEAVIHLAAISSDPIADYDPERAWEVNATGTAKLAQACKERGIQRFTYASSCSIYGGLNVERPQHETDPVRPQWAYSESKYEGERILLSLTDEAFQPVILRQGSVYGFSPRLRADMVVHAFVRDALVKGKLSLHGGGTMWLPLVEIADVARAHIACLEAPLEMVGGETFNVVYRNYQIKEVATTVAAVVMELLGREVEIEQAPLPPKYRDYQASGAKIRETLGFAPRISVQESVAALLEKVDVQQPWKLYHPRHYNIEWMSILQELKGVLTAYPKV